MMKEIRANGPVIVDFEAAYEFFTYNGGVMVESPRENDTTQLLTDEMEEEVEELSTEADEQSDNTYEDYNLQWQTATHSCLIVGWGFDEQDEMKYWIVRNSYGADWGEEGNFRVRRGLNDFGFEGNLVAFDPVLLA